MTAETVEWVPCIGGPKDGHHLGRCGLKIGTTLSIPMLDLQQAKAIWLEENESWPCDEYGRLMYKDAQGNWKTRQYSQAVYRLEETPDGPVYRFEGMRE